MKIKRKTKYFWIFSLLVITTSLTTLIGCQCGNLDKIIIENQTDQTLSIYTKENFKLGEISPGKQIEIDKDPAFGPLYIIAIDTRGEIVLEKEYSYESDLIKIRSKTYKAIIPPLN